MWHWISPRWIRDRCWIGGPRSWSRRFIKRSACKPMRYRQLANPGSQQFNFPITHSHTYHTPTTHTYHTLHPSSSMVNCSQFNFHSTYFLFYVSHKSSLNATLFRPPGPLCFEQGLRVRVGLVVTSESCLVRSRTTKVLLSHLRHHMSPRLTIKEE